MLRIFGFFLGVIGGILVAIFKLNPKKPLLESEWHPLFEKLSSAEFHGNLVTLKNIRNFKYKDLQSDPITSYYDKTYNLDQLTKVWYIVNPILNNPMVVHTFLSFEFSNGDFLSISIEARRVKGDTYHWFKGLFHTYPLMYIAIDEMDAVFFRANIAKEDVYIYPVKLSTPSNAKLLLVDMLEKMNRLTTHPEWYNTLLTNCTSQIAYHVNKLFPGSLPYFGWQDNLTGFVERFALKRGLLDTTLPYHEARKKFYVTKRSQEIGYASNYSQHIREFNK